MRELHVYYLRRGGQVLVGGLISKFPPSLCVSLLQGELQEARQSLLDGLDRSPELDRLVSRLSFSQCLYLHSIHRLEALRYHGNHRHVTCDSLSVNPFQTGEQYS